MYVMDSVDNVRLQKKQLILRLLKDDGNIDLIKMECVMKYGLVDNEVRKLAWPILVGSDEEPDEIDPSLIELHPSCSQVKLDTSRMKTLMPNGLSEVEYSEIENSVTRLVVSFLIDNPRLHYYQGFHDVCYIFYSVLGERKARALLNKLAVTHFSVFMQETMDFTLEHIELIMVLLGHEKPTILQSIESVGLGPDFAVAWVITWFAHVLPNIDDVRRLYDLILATEPIMLIYLCVSIIIASDEEVSATPSDFGLLYQTLARLPKLHAVEDLVRGALKIYISVQPPKLLELSEQRIRRHLKLKSSNQSRQSNAQLSNTKWSTGSVLRQLKIQLHKSRVVGFLGAILVAILAYSMYNRT